MLKKHLQSFQLLIRVSAVARSENPGEGARSNTVGIMCPPPVEIGLTDVPKTGGARAPLHTHPGCNRPDEQT